MKALDSLRRAIRRLVADETGLPAEQPRHFTSALELSGRATQAARLPIIVPYSGTDPALRNEDGDMLYMMDYDPLDGDNPLG